MCFVGEREGEVVHTSTEEGYVKVMDRLVAGCPNSWQTGLVGVYLTKCNWTLC